MSLSRPSIPTVLVLGLLSAEAALAQMPAQPAGPRTPTEQTGQQPWRAHAAIELPELRFGLEHRIRFEHLENDFRTANLGNASGFSTRILLSPEFRFRPVVVGAEFQDSRLLASHTTPLNTTLVNPLELLQGYVGLRGKDVLVGGDTSSLTAGRMTIDVGSRRLVARNEFRNTINAFTGLELTWESPARDLVRAMAVMPVLRLPSDFQALRGNRVEVDRENTDALFWAAFFKSRPLAAQVTVETYVFGLHERDGRVSPGSNRQLFTPGVRLMRPPARGAVDFQLEVMTQFGRSRASIAAEDTTDLEHRAFSLHASSGYHFDVPWMPRLVLQYDYASGDGSPTDEVNHRFDPLFGARRFEFGPTGLYGAIARSNLNSPGVRLEVQPHRAVDAFAAYRLVWLASARDVWPTAGLRDVSGSTGRFVGQQAEARVRCQVLPGNLSFDLGSAVLVRGAFAENAPGGSSPSSVYVYTQVTGTI